MAGGHECLFPTASLPHQNICLSSRNITEADALQQQVAGSTNYHFPAQKAIPYSLPAYLPECLGLLGRQGGRFACEPRALGGLWGEDGDHCAAPAALVWWGWVLEGCYWQMRPTSAWRRPNGGKAGSKGTRGPLARCQPAVGALGPGRENAWSPQPAHLVSAPVSAGTHASLTKRVEKSLSFFLAFFLHRSLFFYYYFFLKTLSES